jgi:polyphosphate kinase
MPRNLYERVEVLVPLREELLRERVRHEILGAYLADNRKARILTKNGTYIRPWQLVHGMRKNKPPVRTAAFNAQEFLIDVAEGKQAALPSPTETRMRRLLVGKER